MNNGKRSSKAWLSAMAKNPINCCNCMNLRAKYVALRFDYPNDSVIESEKKRVVAKCRLNLVEVRGLYSGYVVDGKSGGLRLPAPFDHAKDCPQRDLEDLKFVEYKHRRLQELEEKKKQRKNRRKIITV